MDPQNHRCNLPQFRAAKMAKLKVLIDWQTSLQVHAWDIPENANILKARFVLAIKHIETNEPRYKARVVIQGHRDVDKHQTIHTSITLHPSSVRMLCQAAMQFNWNIWCTDINQAYIQSGQLARPIYMKPILELELPPGVLLKIRKPLYGLCDSGDHWFRALKEHYKNGLSLRNLPLTRPFTTNTKRANYPVSLDLAWKTQFISVPQPLSKTARKLRNDSTPSHQFSTSSNSRELAWPD